MNLPNKLTITRVILIPFFVIFLLCFSGTEYESMMRLIADIIFIAASITDALDGHIARSRNLITNFGKFMDPLADKLLVDSAFICLMYLGQVPVYFVLIVVAREFIISGFRLIAAENGLVIAASYWGKFKTAFSMVMVIVMVLTIDNKYFVFNTGVENKFFFYLGQILMWISLALTVISLIDYIVKNKDVLKEQA